MSQEKHTYTRESIPGGHECYVCGQVNTCYFYSGYYIELENGGHEHHETIECDECGHQETIVWVQEPKGIA